MKVKSESEVAQSCPTLSDPMDCSLPGSSVHGIFQARVLEWAAVSTPLLKELHWNDAHKRHRHTSTEKSGGERRTDKELSVHPCELGRG